MKRVRWSRVAALVLGSTCLSLGLWVDRLLAHVVALQEERSALAHDHYETGAKFFHELRYREAALHLQCSAALDPGKLEVLKLRDRALWILGDRPLDQHDTRSALALPSVRRMKIQQARLELEQIFAEGERLIASERYDAAQDRFERVLEGIRWFPYDDAHGLKTASEARLAVARRRVCSQGR